MTAHNTENSQKRRLIAGIGRKGGIPVEILAFRGSNVGAMPAYGSRQDAALYTEGDARRFSELALKIMDQLWTPWRYSYVTNTDGAPRPGIPAQLAAWPGDTGCVFCNLLQSVDYAIAHGMSADQAEEIAGLVVRGEHCYVCLNAYPYTSGHVMVVPYNHLDRLAGLTTEGAHEMMDLARKTERVMENLYRPHGLNFGLNLGKAAGAGVAEHLHLHALPRWVGDTNFMTTVAETRVLPEDLTTTWKRMRAGFAHERR